MRRLATTRAVTRAAGFVAALAVALMVLLAPAAGRAASHATSELTVVGAGGSHRFRVELVDDDRSRARGLMFRRSLPADGGMLFDFGRDQPISMWMKNTLIPLDMLFIDRHGVIVNLHQRAVPHSLAAISSVGRVRAVLELNGGTVSRLKIQPGDRVRHPMFDDQ